MTLAPCPHTYRTYLLLVGSWHHGVQRDDYIVATPEHRAGHQQVVQLGNGVPAGEEDQNGPLPHGATDVLHQLHHKVEVDVLLVHLSQRIDDVVREDTLFFQPPQVLFSLPQVFLLLLVLLTTFAKAGFIRTGPALPAGLWPEAGGSSQ